MSENKKHNYGIDLLRVVAMFMIIAHHFSIHSGIEFVDISSNSIFMSIMALGGKTGVNIFVLITGFYSTGKIRGKKIANLIGSTTLYSVVLTMVVVLYGYISINKKMLIKTVFPILFGNSYWFIVIYLELYVLIPLLNNLVKSLDERKYKQYIILFTCLFCIIPSIVGRFIQTNDFGYSTLIWFVYLYFVGAYLRLYGVPKIFGGKRVRYFGLQAV